MYSGAIQVLWIIAFGLTASLTEAQVVAQAGLSSSTKATPAPDQELTEIVVTAEKRPADLEHTAIAMSVSSGIETVISHHLFRSRAERFGDLRERQDLRRCQRDRARHLAQSGSVQCRAVTITAARSVILLIAGRPRCRSGGSRASRQAASGRSFR